MSKISQRALFGLLFLLTGCLFDSKVPLSYHKENIPTELYGTWQNTVQDTSDFYPDSIYFIKNDGKNASRAFSYKKAKNAVFITSVGGYSFIHEKLYKEDGQTYYNIYLYSLTTSYGKSKLVLRPLNSTELTFFEESNPNYTSSQLAEFVTQNIGKTLDSPITFVKVSNTVTKKTPTQSVYSSSTQKYDANNGILYEEFNNSNNWKTYLNTNEDIKVQNGVYRVQRKGTTGTSNPISKYNYLNDTDDYIIEAHIRHISGVDNYGHGLHFGAKDFFNTYTFMVSGNGSFVFGVRIDNVWTTLVPWTKSSHINTHYNSTNKLKVIRKKYLLELYINNSLVKTLPAPILMGKKVGFFVEKNQVIEVDRLIIKKR